MTVVPGTSSNAAPPKVHNRPPSPSAVSVARMTFLTRGTNPGQVADVAGGVDDGVVSGQRRAQRDLVGERYGVSRQALVGEVGEFVGVADDRCHVMSTGEGSAGQGSPAVAGGPDDCKPHASASEASQGGWCMGRA